MAILRKKVIFVYDPDKEGNKLFNESVTLELGH